MKWNDEKQSTLDMTWNEHLSELIKFKQLWGHCKVPKKYARNPNLGRWAIYHRSQYRLLKSGKKSSISDERIAQLEKLEYQWNYDSQLALDMAWNEHISELMELRQQWGHCKVPKKYARNPNLGCWVIHQRSKY